MWFEAWFKTRHSQVTPEINRGLMVKRFLVLGVTLIRTTPPGACDFELGERSCRVYRQEWHDEANTLNADVAIAADEV